MTEPNQESQHTTPTLPSDPVGDIIGSTCVNSTSDSPNQTVDRTSTNSTLTALNLNQVRRASYEDNGSKSARDHKEPLPPRSTTCTSARRSISQLTKEVLVEPLRRTSINKRSDVLPTNPAAAAAATTDDTGSQNIAEDELFAAVDEALVPEIEAYLREKIQCNRSDTKAKDIREFVLSRLSSVQIRQVLPPLLAKLQSELGGSTIALDIQTSFCMMEDLFSDDLGRASPLVGMYTDEEEDMLKSLELRTVL
ncbi:hypothetical protein H257_13335 [Aphanomyces astaci]|uniref:Uncharacterized protein n=2 Tax=Aphanomyces astaci TaxID=112090 RepID=W4FVD6_APHAT|nr:hypothetical protein H257_13335 [Aphanomyces astaci]ETV71457.1 hypothetical protein H257_13335 [Aphanomyces astaci]|eukprot:XP_009839122.1 hypothetical protein H257_13335 [Aphanomyces astaci]